jgi:purine nucleoside phosphorylase
MLGVIGGTSLFHSQRFAGFDRRHVHTPYGEVVCYCDSTEPSLVFLQRHHADAHRGVDAYTPPHRINHRANLYALKQVGVDRCVGVYSVGSLNPAIRVGTCVLTHDFCSLAQLCRAETFYDEDMRGHAVIRFDQMLRDRVLTSLKDLSAASQVGDSKTAETSSKQSFVMASTASAAMSFHDGGVYVQTAGPRFETPAEVRMLRTFGDVVGMTGASEAVSCGELGIPYMQVCFVDNLANGLISGAEQTEIAEFHDNVKANLKRVEVIIDRVIETLRH